MSMPIIEDFDAIAKRMRELRRLGEPTTPSPEPAGDIGELENWRDAAWGAERMFMN